MRDINSDFGQLLVVDQVIKKRHDGRWFYTVTYIADDGSDEFSDSECHADLDEKYFESMLKKLNATSIRIQTQTKV